ncbi:MAG TPA: hypothetical protein VG929_09815 [Actinomycetota bacterium]|nr:hypothetical protein [Actinomycetota bacterium]
MTHRVRAANDVLRTSQLCRTQLEPHLDRDWSVPAGLLEWSCRETVAHIADALGFYTAHLASQATEWLKFDIVPHADATHLHLLRLVEAVGAAFADVIEATPPDVQAFHHSGMWDRTGFAAMGCLETLVHTGDVAAGLEIAFDPPRDVCEAVVERVFIGAPRDQDSWDVLWWATGRGELPERERLGADWLTYWINRRP